MSNNNNNNNYIHDHYVGVVPIPDESGKTIISKVIESKKDDIFVTFFQDRKNTFRVYLTHTECTSFDVQFTFKIDDNGNIIRVYDLKGLPDPQEYSCTINNGLIKIKGDKNDYHLNVRIHTDTLVKMQRDKERPKQIKNYISLLKEKLQLINDQLNHPNSCINMQTRASLEDESISLFKKIYCLYDELILDNQKKL